MLARFAFMVYIFVQNRKLQQEQIIELDIEMNPDTNREKNNRSLTEIRGLSPRKMSENKGDLENDIKSIDDGNDKLRQNTLNRRHYGRQLSKIDSIQIFI